MRAVIQRVSLAEVHIGGERTAAVGAGLAVLLGVSRADGPGEAAYLAGKIAALRVFEDEAGKLNRSLLDTGGAALVVSNFTLMADTASGRRPSFIEAARPQDAQPLYALFVSKLREAGVRDVQTGTFGADMRVRIDNDGPVTILMDTDVIRKG